MGSMAFQITSLAIVYPTIYSDVDQRKHQSSASLAFVRGFHRGPVNSPHKWPVTRKMFPFDDVIMLMALEVVDWQLLMPPATMKRSVWPLGLNTLRSRSNGLYFADDNFNCIFYWMKIFIFRTKFHCYVFLMVWLAEHQHSVRLWFSGEQATCHCLNQCWHRSRRPCIWHYNDLRVGIVTADQKTMHFINRGPFY